MLMDTSDIDLIKGITRKEAKAVHKDLPEGGVWRTIKGHHVYIKDGKVLAGSIPGVTKAKKATKEHLKAHQEHVDNEGKKKGTKKDAKGKSATAGKTAKPKPAGGGAKKAASGKTGAKKTGKDSAGGKTAKQVKGKANGTTKVGAKTDGKSKSTKPTPKSGTTGKSVQATGKKKSTSEGGAKSKPAAKAGGINPQEVKDWVQKKVGYFVNNPKDDDDRHIAAVLNYVLEGGKQPDLPMKEMYKQEFEYMAKNASGEMKQVFEAAAKAAMEKPKIEAKGTDVGEGEFALFHGTKLWHVADIMEQGFTVNGSKSDFGNAAYFKSPTFDPLDHADYQEELKRMKERGFEPDVFQRTAKGNDTTRVVKYFAGKSNNAAVVKASVAKEHVLDCTKGRPPELQKIIEDMRMDKEHLSRHDNTSLKPHEFARIMLEHAVGMDTSGMTETEMVSEFSKQRPKLRKSWGDHPLTSGTVSPYELYARKSGIKAIVDKLDGYDDEGWQIGVYDPKLIRIHDHGWDIKRTDIGAELRKAILKALSKGRNPGHCLLHFEMTEEGLVMHIGAIGDKDVPEAMKKSLMKSVLAEGAGDVSAVYDKELRKARIALKYGFEKSLTTGVQRKRSAYEINWMAIDDPVDEVLYIPTNRLNVVYQTEAATDWDKVNENLDKMKRGVPLAPVVIGLDYDIHDGHHRYEASKIAGYEHVPCVVKGGSEVDRRRAIEAYQEVWKSIQTDPTDPRSLNNEGFMFRGIGLRELHAINKSKFIQSKGKGNDDDKGTNTCFSNLFQQAEGYARSQYDLYDEKAAFVLVVNRVPWIEEDEHGELISDRPIPSTRIYDIIPVPKEDIVKGWDASKHPREANGRFSTVEENRYRSTGVHDNNPTMKELNKVGFNRKEMALHLVQVTEGGKKPYVLKTSNVEFTIRPTSHEVYKDGNPLLSKFKVDIKTAKSHIKGANLVLKAHERTRGSRGGTLPKSVQRLTGKYTMEFNFPVMKNPVVDGNGAWLYKHPEISTKDNVHRTMSLLIRALHADWEKRKNATVEVPDIEHAGSDAISEYVKNSKPFGKGAKVPVKNLKNPVEQELRDTVRGIVKEFKQAGDNRQPFDKELALNTIANLKKMGFRRMKNGDDDSHAAYGVEYNVNPKKALLMTVHIGKAGYDFNSVRVNVYRYKDEANFDPSKGRKKSSGTYFMGIR